MHLFLCQFNANDDGLLALLDFLFIALSPKLCQVFFRNFIFFCHHKVAKVLVARKNNEIYTCTTLEIAFLQAKPKSRTNTQIPIVSSGLCFKIQGYGDASEHVRHSLNAMGISCWHSPAARLDISLLLGVKLNCVVMAFCSLQTSAFVGKSK